jgi:hypothetical protein
LVADVADAKSRVADDVDDVDAKSGIADDADAKSGIADDADDVDAKRDAAAGWRLRRRKRNSADRAAAAARSTAAEALADKMPLDGG